MRDYLGKLLRRLEAYGRLAPWTKRAALLLVALAMTGGIWLAASPGGGWVPLGRDLLAGRDISGTQSLLASAGIPVRRDNDRLLVPKESLPSARQFLKVDADAAKDPASSFQALADQDDIWRTQPQNDKRWQAAKMAVLGRLIAQLPSVASAAVIFETPSPRTLGGPAQGATAAVKVNLREGERMTPSLAEAIADLVAGSVSGLNSQDVRIVDGAGTSYHAGVGTSAPEGEFHRRQLLEAYNVEKVRQALRYIENLVVTVTVIPSGGSEKMTASLAVPRTYLAAVVKEATVGRSVSPEESTKAAEAELARIQQAAARVLNVTVSDVHVDCYHDVVVHSASESGSDPSPTNNKRLAATAAVFGAALLAGFLALAVRHARSRKLLPQTASGTGKTPNAEPGATDDSQVSGLALLETLNAEDIASVLQGEHPQAAAAVLGHLPAAKSAAILAGLDKRMQAEVSHRLTEMQPIDPATLEELVGQLTARLKSGRSKTAGEMDGQGKMAEILRHADPETERAVLGALAGAAPSLADSVRRRMLVFEDIAELPAERLGAALETVSGEDLAIALRTAAGEFKDKVLSCLSQRASDRLGEETERIGPVRLSEVEAAQQRVAQAVRDAEAGRYVSGQLSERRQLLA